MGDNFRGDQSEDWTYSYTFFLPKVVDQNHEYVEYISIDQLQIEMTMAYRNKVIGPGRLFPSF